MLNRNATAVTVNNHVSLAKLLVTLGGTLPDQQTSGIKAWRKLTNTVTDAHGRRSTVENNVLRAVSQILAARATENGEAEARVTQLGQSHSSEHCGSRNGQCHVGF